MAKWVKRVYEFSRSLSLGCMQGGKGNQWSSVSYCFCLCLRSTRLEGAEGSQKLAVPARVSRAVTLLAGEAKVERLLL